jgi:hypothetical protein
LANFTVKFANSQEKNIMIQPATLSYPEKIAENK